MLSAGVGAGLVLGGRLYRGSAGIAGELGHVRLRRRRRAVPLRPARLPGDGRVDRRGARACCGAPHGDELTLAGVLELAGGGRPRLPAGAERRRPRGRPCARRRLQRPRPRTRSSSAASSSAAGAPLLDGIRRAIERHALPALAASIDVRLGVLGERAALLGAIGLVAGDTERVRSEGLPALDARERAAAVSTDRRVARRAARAQPAPRRRRAAARARREPRRPRPADRAVAHDRDDARRASCRPTASSSSDRDGDRVAGKGRPPVQLPAQPGGRRRGRRRLRPPAPARRARRPLARRCSRERELQLDVDHDAHGGARRRRRAARRAARRARHRSRASSSARASASPGRSTARAGTVGSS